LCKCSGFVDVVNLEKANHDIGVSNIREKLEILKTGFLLSLVM
jgi:hypothetical protein